jgi:endonuclease YncB( thermonuclease family)
MMLIGIMAVFIVSTAVSAAQFDGVTVIRVIDGDSIIAMTSDNQRLSVRLAGIDAPELRQPYGQQSRENLSRLLSGNELQLECPKLDRFQRHVCEVRTSGNDAGLAQLIAGFAWWYRQYQREQSIDSRIRYAAAEAEARAARRGLWAEEAIEPAQWRRSLRAIQTAAD